MEKENAASEKHVKKMAGREERVRHRFEDDIKSVLSSIHGKRLVWRILSHCGTFKSVHHPSGSQVYYNAGQQDIGHWLMQEIVNVDAQKLVEMMREAKDYEHV